MSIFELPALGVAGEGTPRSPTAPTPGRRPGAQVGQRPGVPETGTGPSPTLVPWGSLAPGEKRLVICEKPSAAKDVAAALGGARRFGDRFESSDTIVAWAFGHLLEPVSPEVYDRTWKAWSYTALPYLPEPFRYAPRDPRAAHQLAALHALVARPDVVALVNACDAGREGELIFKLIVQAAPKGATKPIMRAWFNSMTAPAILAAFAALRPDAAMGPLEDAARCRQEADWLLGINATRAATVQVGGGSMISLGRVQTPTLALIARRDTAIDAFVASPFWQIRAHFTAAAGSYEGLWVGETGDRFVVEADARAAAAEVRAGAYATVAAVDVKAISEQAPQLFDLTTLQREANSRWSWSASRTLIVAQACYETFKLLTYPRTDSRYLTTAMIPELGATAGQVGAAVAALARPAGVVVTAAGARLPKRIVDDAKVSDHHAIIPTNAPHALGAADNDARQLYDLVARRFLAAFHPAARLERTLRPHGVPRRHVPANVREADRGREQPARPCPDRRYCPDRGWGGNGLLAEQAGAGQPAPPFRPAAHEGRQLPRPQRGCGEHRCGRARPPALPGARHDERRGADHHLSARRKGGAAPTTRCDSGWRRRADRWTADGGVWAGSHDCPSHGHRRVHHAPEPHSDSGRAAH